MFPYALVLILGQVAAEAPPEPTTVPVNGLRQSDAAPVEAPPEDTTSGAPPEAPVEQPPAAPELRPRSRAAASSAAPAVAMPAEAALGAPVQAGPPGRVGAPARATPRQPPASAALTAPAESVPPASPPGNATLQDAATFLTQILALDETATATNRKVRLQEVLPRIADPGLADAAIRSYWDLSQAIAALQFAGDKVRLLGEIPAPSSPTDQALLEEMLTAAEAEEVHYQDRLLAAQYQLARVSGMSIDTGLPWPTDLPLVDTYHTRFESIFAGRPAPLVARQIHHRLPGKLRLIEKRFAAMSAAEATFYALRDTPSQGHLSGSIDALQRMDRARHAFLAAIIDYNGQIAEYSLAVVGPAVGAETLVSTLIKSPAARPALVQIPAQDVRQAGAQTLVR